MKTVTAGTKPCKKCVYILPLNVATVPEAKHAPKTFNSERRCEKLAIAVRVLQNTYNLVNSRC